MEKEEFRGATIGDNGIVFQYGPFEGTRFPVPDLGSESVACEDEFSVSYHPSRSDKVMVHVLAIPSARLRCGGSGAFNEAAGLAQQDVADEPVVPRAAEILAGVVKPTLA